MENEKNSSSRVVDEPSSTGLSILVDPESPTLDIVFVHGFKGHPLRTWSHKTEYVNQDGGEGSSEASQRPAKKPRLAAAASFLKGKSDRKHVFWPRDLIPETLPTARVIAYGYDTNIRHSLGTPVSQNTVYDIASDFLQSLEAERRSQPLRPLIFIAHSLGGIVVKEALRRSHGFAIHHVHLHQIYESTLAILFFGTPHGGADPRGLLASIAEKAIRVAGFTVNEEVVKSLLPTSERLRELRDEFAPMAHHKSWTIYSFQEQYGIQLLQGRKVVEDVSSCLGDPILEMTQHIASNHMDMCRFSGFEDVEYRKVVAALEHAQTRIAEKHMDSPSPDMPSQLTKESRQHYMDSLWYSAIDARHATIKTAHSKTCRWILEKSEYRDWLDGNKTMDHHGFLWIRGKPGSGKSTMMKFALANMRNSRKKTVVISFFFNARGEDLEKTTLGMYRSLLFQLLKAIPALQIDVMPLRSTVPEGETYTWEENDLQNLFASVIQGLGKCSLICFIDALDECDEGQMRDLVAFLERLGQIAMSSQIQFHVCLSSRHYPHVSLRHGIGMILQDQEGHFQDIDDYLSYELKVGQGAQRNAIKEEILQRSSGIFLWVALVVQILNKEYDHGRIHSLRKRLKDIPDGLEKLFEDMLTRDQEKREELLLCLQLVLYAERPLRPEQLYHALLCGVEPETLLGEMDDDLELDDIGRFILSCSKGLVEITKHKVPTVQFIHESVRDFLRGQNGLDKINFDLGIGLSQDRLKQCCYNYMLINTSEYLRSYLRSNLGLPKASSKEAKNLRHLVSEKFPFLEYAVRNVLYHANVANGHNVSQDLFLQQFNRNRWILLSNVFQAFPIRRHTSSASMLYILAEKKLSNLIRIQIQLDQSPETAAQRDENERYGTPLNAALANNNVSEDTIRALLVPVVQTLSRNNGLPDAQPDDALKCVEAVIQALARDRSDLDPQSSQSWVCWAASHGDEDVVNFVLAQKNVDPDLSNKYRQTPLLIATERGHEKVVRLLLAQEDVDLETGSLFNGETPLFVAAKQGYEGIVRLFLAQDRVNLNPRNDHGETPLSIAAIKGHKGIVRSLLACEGVDVECVSGDHLTPLSRAVETRSEELVRLFLTRENIDLVSKDKNGQTPLSKAIHLRCDGVVDLLLIQERINLNSTKHDDLTPLLRAVIREDTSTVHSLLEQEYIDLESADSHFHTPLLKAVLKGHQEIVRLLLQANVDINARDVSRSTPLLLAVARGSEELVRLLLTHKDINSHLQGYLGHTPLHTAVSQGNDAIVRLLLARNDLNVNIGDESGFTPLQTAISEGEEGIVRLLLARNDIKPSFGFLGTTPLLEAVCQKNESIVRLLLEHKNFDMAYEMKDGAEVLSTATKLRYTAIIDILRLAIMKHRVAAAPSLPWTSI